MTRVEIGATIQNYTVLKHLSDGGMAEVYLAEDNKIKRRVVLKVIRKKHLSNPEIINRFKEEAVILGRLEHPNIVKILHNFDWEDRIVMVLKYIKGITLKEWLAKHRSEVNIFGIQAILKKIASAIEYCHARDIFHRDLSLSNILLEEDLATPLLIDFGIAKQPDRLLTEQECFLGTQRYCSPEQARGLKIDRRSDVFVFGLITIEILTGLHPFAEKKEEVMRAIAMELPLILGLNDYPYSESLDSLNLTDSDWQKFVERALSKDVSGRYATPTMLLKAIFAKVDGHPSDDEDTMVIAELSKKTATDDKFHSLGVQIQAGPLEGCFFPLTTNRHTGFGCSHKFLENDVCIFSKYDQYISDSHALMRVSPNGVQIMDQSSEHGTLIDATKIKPGTWYIVKDFFVIGITVFKLVPYVEGVCSMPSRIEDLSLLPGAMNGQLRESGIFVNNLIDTCSLFFWFSKNSQFFQEVMAKLNISVYDLECRYYENLVFQGEHRWLNKFLELNYHFFHVDCMVVSPLANKMLSKVEDDRGSFLKIMKNVNHGLLFSLFGDYVTSINEQLTLES